MKEQWRKIVSQMRKLRVQVFLAYFLVLSGCFLVLGTCVELGVRNILIDQIGSSRIEVLRQISERAASVKTSATTLAGLYRYELDALDAQSSTPDQVRQKLEEDTLKYNDVYKSIGMNHELVVLTDDFVFSSSPEENAPEKFEKQLWYRNLKRNMQHTKNGTVTFSSTFCTSEDGRYQFAAAQFINPGNKSDLLMVLIDESVLERLYAPALVEGGAIYFYDENGYIVSHTEKNMLGKQFINVDNIRSLYGINSSSIIQKQGEDYLFSTYLDENTGWTIVEEIPAQHIFGVLDQVYRMISKILMVCLLLSLLIALYQSRRISRPLSRLCEAMKAFDGQNFVPLSTETGATETDNLSRSFNKMAMEITNLMDTVQTQAQQKRVAEMNFLRAQINPHFLYNMLFSIRCTVEIGKSEQAVQMIEAFTDLLKSTLKRTGETIELKDEFESTRKYLVVQKLRYGENIQFEMDLAAGTEACMVPPLILQPLVENAIFHGLEAREEADMIVVSSTLEGDDLLLTVTDDGAGMDEQTLKKVNNTIAARANDRQTQSDSIGLANVHNRIRLNYGEEYGVSITSIPFTGTTVTIRLPARYKEAPKSGQERQE